MEAIALSRALRVDVATLEAEEYSETTSWTADEWLYALASWEICLCSASWPSDSLKPIVKCHRTLSAALMILSKTLKKTRLPHKDKRGMEYRRGGGGSVDDIVFSVSHTAFTVGFGFDCCFPKYCFSTNVQNTVLKF
jgi:hypothetical protein